MERFQKGFMTALLSLTWVVALMLCSPQAQAASASEIDREVRASLENLFETSAMAQTLSESAKGVLVFPNIIKAGFIFGGQYGEGALLKDGETDSYYSSVAASWGLQAGVQSFGYALFFMSDDDLQYLDESKGWEVGVGPNIVIIEAGAAENITTTTGKDGVYAFIFSQKGLMAGIGIEGSKITKVTK